MATAEQLKSLIRSHFSNETERFYTVALQVAAHEAKQGHDALAHDIRGIVDTERKKKGPRVLSFPNDLRGLVFTEEPTTSFASFVTSEDLSERIHQVVHEFRQQNKLKAHGLSHRRKMLLIGPPGTGKTMTARVLANELSLPLNTIQVDRIVTKFMGETSSKLRQIFDLMQEELGVYLFDEFDAIGGERSLENDVGEMRRVLNAFLQFIDQDTSDSIIVAASNNPKLLDQALFRRFDDVLYYDYPDPKMQQTLIENVLGSYKDSKLSWVTIKTACQGLSHAEIDIACRDAMKRTILDDKQKVTSALLVASLRNRKATQPDYKGKE